MKKFRRFSRLTSLAVVLGLVAASLTAFAACGGDDDDDDDANNGDTTEPAADADTEQLPLTHPDRMTANEEENPM